MDIKEIFRIKQNGEPSMGEPPATTSYFESGQRHCAEASGNSEVMSICMDNNYESFRRECSENLSKQEELRGPLIKQKSEIQAKISETQAAIENDSEQVELNTERIAQIHDQITNIKRSPEKYTEGVERKSRVSLFVGLSLLIPISIYLLVFYISASYSAFFKIFGADGSVIESIFDGKALSKAFSAGFIEGVFVVTIPFAFMGIGYLMYMFGKQAERSVAKTAALLGVTFIFDFILAYQIESKIYEINKTLDSAPFDVSVAIMSPGFWGIIFAGFVVYLIWGLVFGFVMKEYESQNKVRAMVDAECARIKKLELQNVKLEASIASHKQQIASLSGRERALDRTLDSTIVPTDRYSLYHSQFVKGWLMTIASTFVVGTEQNSRMIGECKRAAAEHIAKITQQDKV